MDSNFGTCTMSGQVATCIVPASLGGPYGLGVFIATSANTPTGHTTIQAHIDTGSSVADPSPADNDAVVNVDVVAAGTLANTGVSAELGLVIGLGLLLLGAGSIGLGRRRSD